MSFDDSFSSMEEQEEECERQEEVGKNQGEKEEGKKREQRDHQEKCATKQSEKIRRRDKVDEGYNIINTNSTTINDENWTYSQQANTTENLDRSLSISIPVLTLNQINQQRPSVRPLPCNTISKGGDEPINHNRIP